MLVFYCMLLAAAAGHTNFNGINLVLVYQMSQFNDDVFLQTLDSKLLAQISHHLGFLSRCRILFLFYFNIFFIFSFLHFWVYLSLL